MKFDFRKIFVIASILFISGMVLVYGYRLIYYYQKEKQKDTTTYTMIEYLTKEENLIRNKLLKKENQYFFGKDASNNYFYFSGLMYRILYLDEENIYLVLDSNATKLKYGETENYDESNIKTWLEEVFTPNLAKQYLSSSNPVTLLNKELYLEMGEKESFLIGEEFWLIDEGTGYVVTEEGELTKPESYDLFVGIKPVVTINGKTKYISGDGTKKNPYTIEERIVDLLADVYVGEYIQYQGKNYRVIENNETSVKALAQEKLPETYAWSETTNKFTASTKQELGYYLNKVYALEFPEKDLVKIPWSTGEYVLDYQETKNDLVNAYVGLLTVGDYFLTEVPNSFLLTKSGYNMYAINADGYLYAAEITSQLDVYPVLSMNRELSIQGGKGTKENPYIVGE